MLNPIIHRAGVAFGAILMLLLAGCQSTPTAPAPGVDSAKAQNYEYIIGPGDQLSIFVWGYNDLSITLPVRPDGKITTRLVEDMPASGKTPTQLSRDIEDVYREFVKNPAPRTVPFRSGMSLLDLMIEVGGLGEFSQGNKSVLVRTTEEGRVSYGVRLDDLLKKGDISADVPISPGDILIIPESWF